MNPFNNECLLDLEKRQQSMADSGVSSFGLPLPEYIPGGIEAEYMRALNYNRDEMIAHVAQDEPRQLKERQ